MKDYIKVLYDDLGKKIDDNTQDIDMLEQVNIVYDGVREKLEKALKQPTDKSDIAEKIKEAIKEIEHDNSLDIPRLTMDDVIEKLKDIIK